METRIEKLEEIIDTPDNIRLRAFNTLSRLILTAYTMVNDYHLKQIDEEIDQIHRLITEQEEKNPLSYRLPG